MVRGTLFFAEKLRKSWGAGVLDAEAVLSLVEDAVPYAVEHGLPFAVDGGVLAVAVLGPVFGFVADLTQDVRHCAEHVRVRIHDNALSVDAVYKVLVIVVDGALFGVDCLAVGRVEDCLAVDVGQNVVANLRKTVVRPVRELEAAHIPAGLEVKDLKGALVEQVVIVRRDRKLAVRSIEQRFTLV